MYLCQVGDGCKPNARDGMPATDMESTANRGKRTTQHAPLEGLLTRHRTRKILPYAKGKRVLDFGCGAHLHTLRTLKNVATARIGFDRLFAGQPAQKTGDDITLIGCLEEIANRQINCVTALACFEHLEPDLFNTTLATLHHFTDEDAIVVGTVPTPPAKPLLEFLSYRLALIDRSQIEDHQVYYDRTLLANTVAKAGWQLDEYKLFQFGFNSFFCLRKRPK